MAGDRGRDPTGARRAGGDFAEGRRRFPWWIVLVLVVLVAAVLVVVAVL